MLPKVLHPHPVTRRNHCWQGIRRNFFVRCVLQTDVGQSLRLFLADLGRSIRGKRVDHQNLIHNAGEGIQAAFDIVLFVAGDDEGGYSHRIFHIFNCLTRVNRKNEL